MKCGSVRPMESFDRSLKHLLALAPAELLGFGLGLTVRIIRPIEPSLLTRERLMQSTLYQQIFSEGEERGEARGETRGRLKQEAETIQRVLEARLGVVDLGVRQRVKAEPDERLLSQWYQAAILCVDADGARQLADQIRQAPSPTAEST
ncbi:MAG: Rpn family recombination-promoting nuclease/putative transposase [Myxococcales bacterium]|nr:Rpn family recombination-promoting nuclease/putative transposase [Myxococcales bacterium]